HGCEVRKQIGCAGFRIDLAVVDPVSPGRYLLGIECDGAQYHSSPVARDRDRLREQILKDLGWRIHRIWSTDWYRNRAESERRLREATKRAKQEEPVSIASAVSPPYSLTQEPATPVDAEEPAQPSTTYETLDYRVPDYEVCSSLGIVIHGELHEQPVPNL